jgi:uncharacterized protein YuzE
VNNSKLPDLTRDVSSISVLRLPCEFAWYDKEADYLEVLFDTREGYFQETENDAVMEKIDKDGNIVGFSVLNVSRLSQIKPLSIDLLKRTA